MATEETWEQKGAGPSEAEPGGGPVGDGGTVGPSAEEDEEEPLMEEEEEVPKPKLAPALPDAPKKEHVNVVFIGHVGKCLRGRQF